MQDVGGGGDQAGRRRRDRQAGLSSGPQAGEGQLEAGLRKPDIQRVSCLLTLLRWLPGTRNLSELEINPKREVGS